jgi:hypothetical protein
MLTTPSFRNLNCVDILTGRYLYSFETGFRRHLINIGRNTYDVSVLQRAAGPGHEIRISANFLIRQAQDAD